jgi:hypothetical protein
LFFMSGSAIISTRRQLLAWWLLLLLGRVLAPEAAVLTLHAHAHTTAEPAFAKAAHARPAKALLTPKHQHCHTDDLYQLPFALATPVELPAPVRQLAYATYRPQSPVCRQAHLLDGACLRGPPAMG